MYVTRRHSCVRGGGESSGLRRRAQHAPCILSKTEDSMKRLRVMISSTIEDLKPERDAVDRAIRHFRFQRFRSELVGSLARSSREVCDELAKECDLYVLIVGRRYGWIVPDLNISVTEREYNVA